MHLRRQVAQRELNQTYQQTKHTNKYTTIPGMQQYHKPNITYQIVVRKIEQILFSHFFNVPYSWGINSGQSAICPLLFTDQITLLELILYT